MTAVRPSRIGWRAAAALTASGHRARVLATLSESVYLTAGDEIVWLGGAGAALHGRAILLSAPSVTSALPPGNADTLGFDLGPAPPWRPAAPPPTPAIVLADRCRALLAALGELGEPRGFGALLAGRTPDFPLDRVADRAHAFVRGCADGDTVAATAAALELIGLGPGLTPAGDDYVGGAFFALTLGADAGEWQRAAAAVVARARSHSHPVSAALLADLCGGAGWAPLHDLAGALATGAPRATAVDAARRLVRIGHSSGWDILAGFVGALAGRS